MAPMRDLICGGCDVVACDICESLPVMILAGAESFSRADVFPCLVGQSAMSARRDQPENTRKNGLLH
jgi:hypothetical protein